MQAQSSMDDGRSVTLILSQFGPMQNKIIVSRWFSFVIHNKLSTNKNYLLNVLCIEIKILKDLELMMLLLTICYVTKILFSNRA